MPCWLLWSGVLPACRAQPSRPRPTELWPFMQREADGQHAVPQKSRVLAPRFLPPHGHLQSDTGAQSPLVEGPWCSAAPSGCIDFGQHARGHSVDV